MKPSLHVVIGALLCLSLAAGTALAGDKTAQTAQKVQTAEVAPKQASTTKASKAAKADKAGAAKKAQAKDSGSQEQAQASFETFAKEWVEKLNRSFMPSSDKKQTVQNGSGFVCRYQAVDPGSVEVAVSPTSSKETPFVGTIKYTENVYECVGESTSVAQEGPFNPVKTTLITEIFRYTNKRWVY